MKSMQHDYLYIGSTNDLEKRLAQHNSGNVVSTRPYYPLELEAYVAVKTEKIARELEIYFKGGSGKAVLKKRIL